MQLGCTQSPVMGLKTKVILIKNSIVLPICELCRTTGGNDCVDTAKRPDGGEDICEVVLDCLRAREINTTHLVSVVTDGAPSMTGAQKGFEALLQKSPGRTLVTFHCTKRHYVLKHFLQNAQK